VTTTVILTLNTERDPSRLLPDAAARRSVVLDTTPLRAATADLDETARRLARATLPPVDPDLVPPTSELPELARRRLREVLRSCLTERGWELVDVEAIARLALGRWAAAPADPGAAVLSVAADYLLVTATRPGLVEPDWLSRLEAIAGGAVGPIAATLANARARQAAGEQDRASDARTALDASLALAGERERLRDALDHALRSVPRGRDLDPDERGRLPPLAVSLVRFGTDLRPPGASTRSTSSTNGSPVRSSIPLVRCRRPWRDAGARQSSGGGLSWRRPRRPAARRAGAIASSRRSTGGSSAGRARTSSTRSPRRAASSHSERNARSRRRAHASSTQRSDDGSARSVRPIRRHRPYRPIPGRPGCRS
jgi:hypothetical protein